MLGEIHKKHKKYGIISKNQAFMETKKG